MIPIPDILPGPCRGGSFKKWNGYKKSMAYRICLRCRSNEVVRCIDEQTVVEMPMKLHGKIHAQLTE
jgi:hypothetical protein